MAVPRLEFGSIRSFLGTHIVTGENDCLIFLLSTRVVDGGEGESQSESRSMIVPASGVEQGSESYDSSSQSWDKIESGYTLVYKEQGGDLCSIDLRQSVSAGGSVLTTRCFLFFVQFRHFSFRPSCLSLSQRISPSHSH